MDCCFCKKSVRKFVDVINHIRSWNEKHKNFKCDQFGKKLMLNLEGEMMPTRLHTDRNYRNLWYQLKVLPLLGIWIKNVWKNCTFTWTTITLLFFETMPFANITHHYNPFVTFTHQKVWYDEEQ